MFCPHCGEKLPEEFRPGGSQKDGHHHGGTHDA
jgi:sarcosine oxidase delta subunit